MELNLAHQTEFCTALAFHFSCGETSRKIIEKGSQPGDRIGHVEVFQDFLGNVDGILRKLFSLGLESGNLGGLGEVVCLLHEAVAGQVGSDLVESASKLLQGVVWQRLAENLKFQTGT